MRICLIKFRKIKSLIIKLDLWELVQDEFDLVDARLKYNELSNHIPKCPSEIQVIN